MDYRFITSSRTEIDVRRPGANLDGLATRYSIRNHVVYVSDYSCACRHPYGRWEALFQRSDSRKKITQIVRELPKSVGQLVLDVLHDRWDFLPLSARERDDSGLFQRNFGIEIECLSPVGVGPLVEYINSKGIHMVVEGYNHSTRDYWKVVTDASVHTSGNSIGCSPIEIVSPILCGQEGLDQVEKVCRCLDDKGVTVNKTCGLHVHHDIAGMSDSQYTSVFYFYARNEHLIDSLVSKSRRGDENQYCQSLYSYFRYANNLPSSRYYKVNPCSRGRHGTIEFRQHQGTTSFSKISNWIRLTQAIVEKAEDIGNNSYASLDRFLEDLELGQYKAYFHRRQEELQ